MTPDAFLAAIAAAPDDDLPRLVYADWLDENATQDTPCDRCQTGGVSKGRIYTGMDGMKWIPCPKCNGRCHTGNGFADRAELIRVQCELAKPVPRMTTEEVSGLRDRERELLLAHGHEWCRLGEPDAIGVTTGGMFISAPRGLSYMILRRGFPAVVRGPLAVLYGGECERCDGRGYGYTWESPTISLPCPTCRGTGTTPGVLPDLVRRWPMVERVEVPGVVRGDTIFRGTGEGDIDRGAWEILGLPKCDLRAESCRGAGTHHHITVDGFSAHLLTWARGVHRE